MSKLARLSWRSRRGLHLVCSIKPDKGRNKAHCEFEGKKFEGFGNSNLEALTSVFKEIEKYV